MKTNKKIRWGRWLLVVGAAAALGGGAAAYAQTANCWKCIPCGCAEFGGDMMCCSKAPC